MSEAESLAQAREIYRSYQDERLAQTALSAMSEWVASGRPPSVALLREAGFHTAHPVDADAQHHVRMARKAFVRQWGFSIPSLEAVEALRGLGPLLEVAAGSGYWTALLCNAGLDIIATDLANAPIDHGFQIGRHAVIEVFPASEAVRRYPERNLFCSWPSEGESWIGEAIAALASGRRIALIIDDRPGVTGPVNLAEVLEASCEEIGEAPIPQFPNVQDRLRLFRRR